MILLGACVATEFVPYHPPDEAGPYDAGVQTLFWTDARGKDLVAEVWYPADAPDGDTPDRYEDIPFEGLAYRDVAPLPGPFPLVAFSHGYSGTRIQSLFLTEWLATHGYVVVAPDHPGNTILDQDDERVPQVMRERPGDIASAVTEAAANFPVSSDDYVMMGHSFGGWTTLAVAGGIVDLDAFADFCAAQDVGICDASEDAGTGTLPDAPDPRAFAGVSMSPCGWYSFGETGLSNVAPTLVMGGDKDDTCEIEEEVRPTFERVPVGSLSVIRDAGHFIFSEICALGPIRPECTEPGYVDTRVAQEKIRTQVTAWVGMSVWGDARYEDWLGADVGVDWTER